MSKNTPMRLEAIHRLGAELPFRVHAGKPKDDRRNKDYYRDVSVSLEIEFDKRDEVRGLVPSSNRVRDIAAELLRSRDIRVHRDMGLATSACGAKLTRLDAPSYYHRWSPLTMYWNLRFAAKRPSEIPAESTVVEWAREHLCPALSQAFRLAIEELREKQRREQAARTATIIARWAASSAVAEAKSVTRYEQRLAALVAEMNAEIEVQVAKMREERMVEQAVADSPDLKDAVPEAIRYAVEHFHERTKGWNSGMFRGPSRDYTTEDLYPKSGDK